MSNWHFRKLGSFDNDADVNLWARQNRVDPRDIKTRRGSDGKLEAEVRESAFDDSQKPVFGSYDRGSGFN